jgi:GGDEF domain-containing protein
LVNQPPRPRTGSTDHLAALADLLNASRKDQAVFFEHGLTLVMKALEVDRALLTRVTGLGYEVFWWALGPSASMDEIFAAPEKGFCPFVMAHPEKALVIRDAAQEARWHTSSGYVDLGIRAYAGVALKVGGQAHGTLCVQHHAPRDFTRPELSLLRAMGHLMALAIESEGLKQELRRALEALELSSAIVEDSALTSDRSGLPNRRYLDIWLRSTLFMARRRKEPMALALWSQPMVAGTKGRLNAAAERLRGEDLLVELSADQYLLLLPHTTESGVGVLLSRLRETLGDHATGATLWLPDGKDMTMKSALRRVAKAFTEANREGSTIVWSHG